MTEREFWVEIWRGLVIILRAVAKRHGFKWPQLND